MLNRLKFHHSKRYQPLARVGHGAVTVGDRLYIWAGWHKSIPKVHTNSDKIKALSIVEVFNLRTGEWGQIPTSGIPPLGVAYYASGNIGDDLYYFGGRCGHSGCHHNSLYRLNTLTMKWKNVVASANNAPMKKAQCGMTGFRCSKEEYLFVFGGYGVLPQTTGQPQTSYVAKRGKPEYGWTNECHIFCLQSGAWIFPNIIGEPPLPSSNFSITSISDLKAVMYGGYLADGSRSDNLYVIEFGRDCVFWNKVSPPVDAMSSPPQPGAFCDHSMTFVPGLYDTRPRPCVIVFGGEDQNGKVLRDCWILNLLYNSWTKINLPSSVVGRLYHSLSSFTLGPHCVWLLVFGGVSTVDDVKDWQDQQMMSDMIIIELVKWENENWMSTVVFDSSLVGITTDDYTRKLMDRVFQGRKDWIQVVTSKKMLNEEQGSVDVSSDETSYVIERDVIIDDGKKHQTTSQSKDFVYENVSSKDILLGDTKDPPLSERMQLKRSEEECQRVKVELKECEERLLTTEKKLEDFHEEAHQEMLRLRNELSSLHLSREINWKVNEDEVTINEKKLSLRTGDVYNGCYRMTGVLCKRLNDIPSQEEFKMSMDIMSQLRHPNLVLFIGATVGDNPLIITESIPFQPLNYRLKESSLPRDQLISIAIDTSRGLSYLHHLSPSPITHGSISSETIYIDDSPRAKIADTGLYPHIIKQPLLPTHTPPEIALNSITHSAAIDVYGFGVTLIEMCCPDGLGASYNEHLTILGQIDWPKMIPIIQNCIQPNPVDRPSITNTLILIQELLQ